MGIKPGTLHAEKQMEKQSRERDIIEGYGGVQRDFGIRSGIDRDWCVDGIEKDNGFIDREELQLGEVICSLPGEQTELGKVLCGLGGTFEISGDAIGVGLRDIGPGSENIKQPGDGI